MGIDEHNDSALLAFLRRRLPDRSGEHVTQVKKALESAVRNYERYAHHPLINDYQHRRKLLITISDHSLEKVIACASDPLIADELDQRVGPERMGMIARYLAELRVAASDLLSNAQKSGRPRDVAGEKWISEVADIFETHFKRRAAVYGSGSSARSSRGPFYELLYLSVPPSFPRYGTLSPLQVTRVLKRRPQFKRRASAKNG